jgi:serine/threonine-protein kinase
MTTPERWEEIDRIFAAALEREPGERAQFLSEACLGDQDLRKEVESLLAYDSGQSLVGNSAVEHATRLLMKFQTLDLGNQTIGPYKIIKSLGCGGMGQVYLGHDTRLNRPVAVKLLSFYEAAENERVRRFQQEALAVSALNHPNILTIYEIFELNGQSFIVTEFVEGQTLHTRIQQGVVAVEDALEIAIHVANALAAAHTAGIAHRDIKPANIMLRPDGLVKVLDFGVAKYIQSESGDERETMIQTKPGAVVGTVAYMSPEQARGIGVDARTDLWSLGVILFEMVSARRPFNGETSLDVMSAVIERNPPSFAELGITVPELYQRIVLKLLQKVPDERYQSANELLTDLKELKKSRELGIHQPGLKALSSKRLFHAEDGEAKTAVAAGVQIDANKTEVTRGERTTRQRISSNRTLVIASLLVAALAAVSVFAYWSYTHRSLVAKSIAVLPFRNESGDSDLEYLSDGMTDSLINSLSQLPQVTVKAHNSVFRYKNLDIDPQRVGSELSVEAILNGRVVQHGDNLTVYLWLVDARNGNQLWGEQYDRKIPDLLTLQREIARDVSEKLRLRLSGTDAQRISKDYTANAEAYQLYLRGQFHVSKLTLPDVQQGISYFEKAIQLDPNYALAYVGLSRANRSMALGNEMPSREYLEKSQAAALKALSLDEGLSEAHTALGSTLFWLDRNWAAAENQLHRALELNPNSANAHLFYAHLLSNTGRHREALEMINRARQLDPLSPFLGALEGQFLVHAGRSDEALMKLKDTFALAPDFWFPHLFAASAYIEKGMYSEAVREAQLATELSRFQTISAAHEGYALAKMGRRDEAREVLKKLLKLNEQRFVPPYHIALVYNALGEQEEMFKWLERSLEAGDAKLTFLKVDPKWNNVRDDPRFRELLRRVGFTS